MSAPRNDNLRSMANGMERVRIVKKDEAQAAQCDDDLHRLVLSMATVLKRRYPNDFKRIMQEMNEKVAA